MGIRRKSEPVRWSEELMQQKLVFFRSTPRFVLQNLYVFGWESDVLFLSKSGYWTEIEIKVSRADFKADLKNKIEKHRILEDEEYKYKPNQFFYAVPKGLVRPEEVPKYAGLLTVSEYWMSTHVEKPAPWIHKQKISPNELELADKFYFNMTNAKREAKEAKRVAKELTDAYSQGLKDGQRKAIHSIIELASLYCPFRNNTEEGRIHCKELNQTRFGICKHGRCNYLGDIEEKILLQLKTNDNR